MQVPIDWLPAQGAPEQLILLLHGWASDAQEFLPLAQALRSEFPQAAIVVPESPLAADAGRRGRQWYSIEGLAEPGVWEARVQTALDRLEPWVRTQQRRLGVGAAATAIGGFSQGAILALQLALRHDGLAGRVLAFGGRLVAPPPSAPRETTIHLFHGGADRIFDAQYARDALAQLGALHGDATVDIAEGVGHELHPALVQCALQRLRNHIPLRTWQAALGAARASSGAG
jgi:phospholipase/carboxylesterase